MGLSSSNPGLNLHVFSIGYRSEVRCRNVRLRVSLMFAQGGRGIPPGVGLPCGDQVGLKMGGHDIGFPKTMNDTVIVTLIVASRMQLYRWLCRRSPAGC